MSEQYDIDFVVMWVNPYDELWLQEKEKYTATEAGKASKDYNAIARYRDWDNLHYWFRSVERFAPWVRKIHFVTWRTVPEWLNMKHPKLNIVLNKQILPEGCDPVFSPNPLETNLHKIPGLAEHFVYFNDDMFLIREMNPEDFYVDGKPREMAVSYVLSNNIENDSFPHMLFSMIGVINGFFNKKEVQKKHFRKWMPLLYGKQGVNTIRTAFMGAFSGIMIPHLPSAMTKKIYQEVWDKIPEKLIETSHHRFRNPMDMTQYIFRYWVICKGEFAPTNMFRYGKEFFMNDSTLGELCMTIRNQSFKMICINDNSCIGDFEKTRDCIKTAFEYILPEKSSFEI